LIIVKISIKEVVYRSSFIVSGPEKILQKNKIFYIISHFKLYKKLKKNEIKLKAKIYLNQIITLENIKYKKLIDDYFIKE
jgi:rod shape-determining protein MreC